MSQDDIVERLLKDPNLFSALVDGLYKKVRDDWTIKLLEDSDKRFTPFRRTRGYGKR